MFFDGLYWTDVLFGFCKAMHTCNSMILQSMHNLRTRFLEYYVSLNLQR